MTATAVTDDQYRRVDAKMLDIKRRLTQRGGPPFDPEELIEFLQIAVEGDFASTKSPAQEVIRAFQRWDHAGKTFWRKLLSDDQLRSEVASLVRSRLPSTGSESWMVAQRLMGRNSHGSRAAHQHFGVVGGKTMDPQHLSVPFNRQILETVAETFVLVWAPPLSIVDIFERHEEVFGAVTTSTPARYLEEREQRAFSRSKIEQGWYLIRKEALPGSHKFSWEGGRRMVEAPFHVPKANIAAYAYAIHLLETGEPLFRRFDVAVDDVMASGKQVHLSHGHDWCGPGTGGLSISDGFSDRGTGVAVARKGEFKN